MIQPLKRALAISRAEKLRYTISEMRELSSTGELTEALLSDDELEEAMNAHLLPWSVENCRRLLRSGLINNK